MSDLKPTNLRTLGLSGCGDSSCHFEKTTGMHTNGGCRCRPYKWGIAINMIERKRIDQLKEKDQHIERLEAALQDAKSALTTLPDDALGITEDADAGYSWPNLLELLDTIDKALQESAPHAVRQHLKKALEEEK